MPYCKNCNQIISKFDTDICPYCGTPHPIESGYKTMDMTKRYDQFGNQSPLYRSRSQKTAAILAMATGPFGGHFFYVRKPVAGIIAILATLLIVGGVACALIFGASFNPALAILIPLAGVWLCHIVYGLLFLKMNSPKDGNGEFLR